MGFLEDRALPKELIPRPRHEVSIGPASRLPPGSLMGVGDYVVGNIDGRYFAVSRSCRHLAGDLAQGSLDSRGCLVCPVHGARYDTKTGHMVHGPRGIYARIPGLQTAFKALTLLLPLTKREVTERGGVLYLR